MKKENILKKNNIPKKYLSTKANFKKKKTFDKKFKDLVSSKKYFKNFFNLFDKKFKFNFEINDLKKFQKYKVLVIIGMGGSILGAEALQQFLHEKIKKRVYFFNNLDGGEILKFKKKEKVRNSLFLVISKSGNTIETISNILSLNVIKKNSKNIIVITEKKESDLFYLIKKFNLFFIHHRNYIGGRYSVISEVGAIPAILMGLNIFNFRSKIHSILKERKFLKDSSIILSDIFIKKKLSNIILLNYDMRLEKFLFWYQQLLAESLGKQGMGLMPVISNSPKDYHSLLQLYLDGPKDKLFYIFNLENKSSIKLNTKNYLKKNNILHDKDLIKIKDSQKNALIKFFKEKKIPFREFIIKSCNESTMGELFSYFIIETILIGWLIGINPFDQPAVEQVKKNTKDLLIKNTKYNF